MKRFYLFVLCICIAFALQAQVSKTVTVTAGGLSATLTTAEKNTVTNLIINGTIDARDFKIMRDEMPLLSVIDLEKATIVAYSGTGGTGGTTTISYLGNSLPIRTFQKKGIKSIVFPISLNAIDQSAMEGCSLLTDLNLPATLTSIGSYAFYACNGLTSIIIPNQVTSIGSNAFASCTNTKTILIPEKTIAIENSAFTGCGGLFTVDSSNPLYSSIDGVLFNKKQSLLIQYPPSKTGIYSIPKTVNYVGQKAFSYCVGLTSIIITDSVKSISSDAFDYCKNLISVFVPTVPPTINLLPTPFFAGVDKTTCTLNVPYGTIGLYQKATGWMEFKNIVENSGLKLSATTVSLSGTQEGSWGTIEITTSTSWKTSSDQLWLNVSPSSGTSNGTITLSAAANTSGTKRIAKVNITATGYPSHTVTVSQDPLILSLQGSGTTTDPYLIRSVAELRWMRDKVNTNASPYSDKVYKLMADLDFEGEQDWLPIGFAPNYSFKGRFDGRRKVIKNIKIGTINNPVTNPMYIYAGLFGYIDGGSIKDLGVEWIGIYTNIHSSQAYIGGLVGSLNNGSIVNCFTTGSHSATCSPENTTNSSSSIVGGLVGIIKNGQIVNSYSSGTVSSSALSSSSRAASGGIAGNNSGQIVNSFSTMSTSALAGSSYSGGISGLCDGGEIINCYSSGSVESTSNMYYAYAGGISGGYAKAISNCLALNNTIISVATDLKNAYSNRINPYQNYANKNNNAQKTVIVKKGTSPNSLTLITNYNNLSDGTDFTGQPISFLNNWVTANPTTNGEANKSWRVVTGFNNGFPILEPTDYNPSTAPTGSGTISDPYGISSIGNLKWMRDKVNTDNANYGNKFYKLLADLDFEEEEDWVPIGTTSNNPFKGNFDGNGKVIRNIHIGTTTTTSKTENAGLFGLIDGGTVSNLGVNWTGIYSSSSSAGGIAGLNNGIIINCFTNGTVSAALYAGNIVGQNNGSIVNCYTTGVVSAFTPGNSYAGGIAGQNSSNIANCYTMGTVSASLCAGGIVGWGNGAITNCYSAGAVLASTTGEAYAGGIIGSGDANVTNCLALNSKITAISISSSSAFANRIGNKLTKMSNNYASTSMVIKTGTSISNLTTISSYNDGAFTSFEPLSVLNNWVNNTKVTKEGHVLNTWKVTEGINDGYPIFDKPTMILSPLKGAGTANDPYLINSITDLWTVTVKVKYENAMYGNKVYKLMADLDFSGQGDWVPIGGSDSTSYTGSRSFKGTFDGNGKTIRNIRIGTPLNPLNIGCAGLFGYINGGKVLNLGVIWSGIHISQNVSEICILGHCGTFIGGIAGINAGAIINCISIGTLTSNSPSSGYIGGISGNNLGNIINCYTSVIAATNGYTYSQSNRIQFDSHAGGISGINSGVITNSFATGVITSKCAGGIVGENFGTEKRYAIITNCYSSGSLNAISDYNIDNDKYSEDKIYVGGISGLNEYGKITNCLALNSTITAITSPSYSSNNISLYRIAPGNSILNNYASAAIVVKSGKSDTETTLITSFTGPNHGADLYGKPLSLLNDWVNANPATNGIPNKQWKVVEGVNNGLPIFDGQTLNQVQSCALPGSGTNSDPYRINTIEELKLMRDLVNFNNINDGNKYYRLMSDLDFAQQEDWSPIGGSEINPFKGNFDGNGYGIKNIKISFYQSTENMKYSGFFGYINFGKVFNFGVKWIENYSFSRYTGGIAGENYGGIIKNCYSTGIFSNTYQIGGIVGYMAGGGQISNSYFRGSVSSLASSTLYTHNFAGGIVGICEGGIINNCYATGAVFASSRDTYSQASSAGGISGWTFGQANNCLALNSMITAIAGNTASAMPYRIGWLGGTNNYANPNMEVKIGTSDQNLTVINDLSNNFHGTNLLIEPIILLNNWATANPNSNGIASKLWKVVEGINDGFPIFNDQNYTYLSPINLNIMHGVSIFSSKSEIIIEGENVGQIKVFNLNGQIIKQTKGTCNRTTININPTGIYLVTVFDNKTKQILGSSKVIVSQ